MADTLSGGIVGGLTGGVFGGGGAINLTKNKIDRTEAYQEKAKETASAVNDEQLKTDLSNIANSQSVDEAIQATVNATSKPVVSTDDVLRTVDPTLADLERVSGIKPTETLDNELKSATSDLNNILNPTQGNENNNAIQSVTEDDLSGDGNNISQEPSIDDHISKISDFINSGSQQFTPESFSSLTSVINDKNALDSIVNNLDKRTLDILAKNNLNPSEVFSSTDNLQKAQGVIGNGINLYRSAAQSISGIPSNEQAIINSEKSKQLQTKLRSEGFNFTITPRDLRDFAIQDDGREQAEQAVNLAKVFGKRVSFVHADGEHQINGVMTPSIKDTIFIDTRTKKAAHIVMGHELSHHMEKDIPDIYNEMVSSLGSIIKDHQQYARAIGVDASQEHITQEIVGDLMGDNFDNQEFWNKVVEYNPGKFKQISDSIIRWLKNFIVKSKDKGFDSEKFVTDARKAQDIIAQAVAKYSNQVTNKVGEGESRFAKRIHSDKKNNEDYVVPETDRYKDNKTGDLATMIDGLPIRLRVGERFDDKKGFGIEHITANGDAYKFRKPPTPTDDKAENYARDIAHIAGTYSEVYNDKNTERKVLRSGRLNKAIIVEKRNDDGGFWNIVTAIPLTKTEADARFGKLEWSSSRNLAKSKVENPSNEIRQREDDKPEANLPRESVSRTHADHEASGKPGEARLRNQSSKFHLNTDKNNANKNRQLYT